MSFDPTKPVQTRDGRRARIICTDRDSIYSIVALVREPNGEESVSSYTKYGRSIPHYGGTSSKDLINIPVRRAAWVNFFPRDAEVYGSREEADEDATAERIACVRVEFEDGEGLP